MRIITLIILAFITSSCTQDNNSTPKSKIEQSNESITIQEIARVALVEAKQYLTNASEQGIDTSIAEKEYLLAESYIDKGDFKQAQVSAVKVRQVIERGK